MKCPICGTVKYFHPSRLKSIKGEGPFCSHECYSKSLLGKPSPLKKTKKVECPYCGKINEKPAYMVERGAKFCNSSCYHNWTRGKPSSNGFKPKPFQKLTSQIKQRAKKKGLEFDLTKVYLKGLFEDQGERCVYTGFELEIITNKTRNKINPFNQASLDRINSSKGYVKGNVQFISKPMNFFKGKLPDDNIRSFFVALPKTLECKSRIEVESLQEIKALKNLVE